MNQYDSVEWAGPYEEELIGEGQRDGVVYKINGVAAKFDTDLNGNILNSVERLQDEYQKLTYLHNAGISVPEPMYCGYLPLTDRETGERECFYGMAMEYIPGVTLDRLSGEEKERATKKRDEELRKVDEVRFVPWDAKRDGNSIWTSYKDIILIDVELWDAPPDIEAEIIDAISAEIKRI